MVYVFVGSTNGNTHIPTFFFEVKYNGVTIGKGHSSRKDSAKEMAAQNAL